MRILLTGTSGFIGQAVLQRLVRDRPHDTLTALVRTPGALAPQGVQQWRCPAVGDHADWATLPDDLLITCIDHPAAANQTFLVSDGEDLSTADLIRRLGSAMGRPARLFPVPTSLLEAGATLLGKRDMAQRLLGNLQLDITHTRETLDWTPPFTVDEGLRRAVGGHSHETPV